MKGKMLSTPSAIALVCYIFSHVVLVTCDFPCLCSYSVEVPVQATADKSSSALGYLYEFDCKAVYTPLCTDSPWIPIAINHQVGYVMQSSEQMLQTCPGYEGPEDIVTTTPTTTVSTPSTSVSTSPSSSSSTSGSTKATTTPTTTVSTPSTSVSTPPSSSSSTLGSTKVTTTPTTTVSTPSSSVLTPPTSSSSTLRSTKVTTPTTTVRTPSSSVSTSPTTGSFTLGSTQGHSSPQAATTPAVVQTHANTKPSLSPVSTGVLTSQSTLTASVTRPTTVTTTTATTTTTTTTTATITTAASTPTTTTKPATIHISETQTMKLQTVSTVIIHPPSTPIRSRCPDGVITHAETYHGATFFNGTTCLELVRYAMDWESAEANCASRGGHLVDILSQNDETMVMSFLHSNNVQENVWIGLNDRDHEETFIWSSGHPVTYTNWAYGRYIPIAHLAVDCVILIPDFTTLVFIHFKGRWDDTLCTDNHLFVCRYEHKPYHEVIVG